MEARAMDPAHHVPEDSLCIGIPPSGRTLTGVCVKAVLLRSMALGSGIGN